MSLKFEWDALKSRSNRRKHGVAFEEAKSVFSDPLAMTKTDPDHPYDVVPRFVTMGMPARFRLLAVVHCDYADSRVRIISARCATRAERTQYEEEIH